MNAILDRLARSQPSFKPRNVLEFFAIQLARALEDTDHLGIYLRLAFAYPPAVLADAYRRIVEPETTEGASIAERYQHELTHGSYRGDNRSGTILACKVERRTVSLSVLLGFQLRQTEVRQLSSDAETASRSTAGFIRWALALFPGCTAALETYTDGDTRRILLTSVATAVLREEGVPVWEVRAPELLEAYGVPPLRTRQEIRRAVQGFWPDHSVRIGDLARFDAAALGLYVHTKRLLQVDKNH